MKKFNQMTERQMTKTNGGMALMVLAGSAVCAGIAGGVGAAHYKK